jgi:uncharacterized protein (TIGR00297 family)
VTVVFTLLAWSLRGVSVSGAFAGAAICFAMYASAGPGAVGILVAVFALTWASTRFGYSRKKRLGTAESQRGRTASQVLANLSVAAACAVAFALLGKRAFVVGAVASLAEAAGDTVSSELGQALSDQAFLITNWNAVAAGTSGGISAIGTVCGLAAASVIGLAAHWLGLLQTKGLGMSVLAAACGMFADSLLGATVERRKLLNNNGVNFLSTLLAATVAILLA